MAKTKAQRIGAMQAKIENKRIHSQIRHYKVNQFKYGIGLLLGVLLLVLLMINVIKFANGGKFVTFSGLFNYLSTFDIGFNVPNLSTLTDAFTISKEWAILDGFRVFLNGLGSLLGVLAYLCANLVYSITFLSKFLIYILG